MHGLYKPGAIYLCMHVIRGALEKIAEVHHQASPVGKAASSSSPA